MREYTASLKDAYERYHQDHAQTEVRAEKLSWASDRPGGIPHGVTPSQKDPTEAPTCAGEEKSQPAQGVDDDLLPPNLECPETLEHCPGRVECQQRTLPGDSLLTKLDDPALGEEFLRHPPVEEQGTWRDRPPML
jgi:hypothetical protein